MVAHDGLMRIFWPSEPIKHDRPSVLIGWRNSLTDVVVACILQDAMPRHVDTALHNGTLFSGSPHPMSHITDRCGPAPLEVLGTLNHKEQTSLSWPQLSALMPYSSDLPYLHLTEEAGLSTQVILYHRPHPSRMQFMSPKPMSLSIEDKTERIGLEVPPFEGINAAEKAEEKKLAELVQKLKLHTVKSYAPTEKELALSKITTQINCSFDVDAVMQKNIDFVRPKTRKRGLSIGERVVESATDLWDYLLIALTYLWVEWLFPVARQTFIVALIAHRIAGESIMLLAQSRIGPNQVALKDISATAQQVDLRLQQFCYWPIQYLTLKQRKRDWECISTHHPEYIRFYNSLWLVANDVIMGVAIGAYIIENANGVAAQADKIMVLWSLDGLRRIISWLMVYPGGLKLNNELARFLGDLFIWVIDYWGGCVAILQPSFPSLIRFIGFASFAGATMPLSLASDFLSLSTLHIHCFYIASARIYSWQLTIITSLFHLFRGKKRNVLRNRIDSCDYELDQLLLGTILFTLLFFLLPTVVVFYATFALARVGVIVVKASLDGCLACLNHFPLFAGMLRVKDPMRLPGGIRFELTTEPSPEPRDSPLGKLRKPMGSVSYITLKSLPLPLPHIFAEYFALARRIRAHYLSASVFFCLATGGFVPPLHRKNLYSLQYSMLPKRRVGVFELWRKLTEMKDYEEETVSANGSTTQKYVKR